MKKAKYLFLLLVMLFIPVITNVFADDVEVTEETTKEKINFYLFRGEGCPHCAEAEEWLDTLAEDEEFSNYYNLVDYEVWYDEENEELMEKVGKKLNTDVSGVPFIVIGEHYFSGFASSMVDEIKEAIVEEYNNENYVDIVREVLDENLSSANEKKNIVIPVIIVSAVALISVIGLVFFTKEK